MTRSIIAATHGDFVEGWRLHPLGVSIYIALWCEVLSEVWSIARSKKSPPLTLKAAIGASLLGMASVRWLLAFNSIA